MNRFTKFLIGTIAAVMVGTVALAVDIGSVNTVAVLRSGIWSASPVINLKGYYSAALGGGGGILILDPTDTTTTDNGCTVFVDAAGNRFKRFAEIVAHSFSYKQCGVHLDGSTNDNALIQNAYTVMGALGGGTLTKEPGIAALPSDSFTAIAVPDSVVTKCSGLGKNATTPDFKMTGTTERAAMFQATDVGGVGFDACGLYGNNTSSSASVGGAIQFQGTAASAPMVGNFVRNSWFSNFKQPYWVYGFNQSAQPMTNVDISSNIFVSTSGNMVNPNDIHYPSAAICFRGQWGTSLNGYIKTIKVSHNYIEATWIKQGTCYYGGTKDIHQDNNTILNAGINTASNSGAYASFAYADANPAGGSAVADFPTDVFWTNDKIESAYSAGYYTAQATNVHVTAPTITGQADTDTLLPKGAISFNECWNCTIDSPVLIDNYTGINLSGHLDGTIQVTSPVIISTQNNATGILLTLNGSQNANHTTLIVNPRIQLTGTGTIGIYGITRSGTSQSIGQLFVNGGRIEATDFDIRTIDATTGGAGVFTGLNVSGGIVLSGAPVTDYFNHASTTTPLIIHGMTINMAGKGATTTRGLVFSDDTRVNIDGVFIQNNTTGTGVALYANNAVGSMPLGSVQFLNVNTALQVFSTNFCTALPTWDSSIGTTIMNCGPNPTGSPQYIIAGWMKSGVNPTDWSELRTLTGVP